MQYNKFFKILLVGFLVFSLNASVYAVEDESSEAEAPIDGVAGSESFEDLNVEVEGEVAATPEEVGIEVSEELEEELVEASQQEDICGFDLPEEMTYNSQVITIRRKLLVDPEETFRVKVFLKNTGTMPWFSNKSKCMGPKMSLGTDLSRDRDSEFYEEGLEGWESSSRVAMDQYRTNPGEIASFTFWGKAGDDEDIIKEYFTPVLKDLQWIDNSRLSFEVMIGDTGESAADLRKKLSYASESGSVMDIDLNAEKTILVDLSEQNAYVKLGDRTIKVFRVSTGAAATPTPVGQTKITLKQEVRVGAKKPHYIMPYYQWFRAGGYGFHALPSLGKANSGVFWTEARNHIGIPVSHGCIRLLPEDAEWLFGFTEIGTNVIVQR